jgi:uncharacterized repeat protein (TIGR03803 family)
MALRNLRKDTTGPAGQECCEISRDISRSFREQKKESNIMAIYGIRKLLLLAAGVPMATAVLTISDMPTALAAKVQYQVLYSFQNGSDGGEPYDTLIKDKAGNLYGTTYGGGAGAGTVFEVAPDGTETVLYAFTGGNDGANPVGSLVFDKVGNLYGTTWKGGADGAGVVFELAPGGTETVLYTFTGGNDGNGPQAGLVMGKKGVLYGTTSSGGSANDGVVFELAPNGTETVLHNFTGGLEDGMEPNYGSLIMDKAGNLYGMTFEGGASPCKHTGYTGCGTVYEVAADGTETVLHSFAGGTADGYAPYGALTEDSAGNLYGTTAGGGTFTIGGTVFKLAPDGTETLLYSFTGGTDGATPAGGVLLDKSGNLYGTTFAGGTGAEDGVAYKLAPDGTETVLHSFQSGSDGAFPYGGLIAKGGTLYGVTNQGGSGFYGTVFSVKK